MYLLGLLRPLRLGGLNLMDLLIRAVVVLIAISTHELAHGFMAYKLGDPTAKSMGRLSLNPLKHLDPVDALCMLFFGFGWAKPVMINPYYFKKPKRDTALVSLAGPLSNFLLAFLGVIVLKILTLIPAGGNAHVFIPISYILSTFIGLNIGLGVFNLIPIPPLDGSKIFLSFLPNWLYRDIMRYEHLGWLILVFALATNVLSPILSTLQQGVFNVLFFLVGGH